MPSMSVTPASKWARHCLRPLQEKGGEVKREERRKEGRCSITEKEEIEEEEREKEEEDYKDAP